MIKAGVIGATIGLIYVMSLTLLSPFCTLCFTPLLGLGVGYLAAKIEQAERIETGAGRGGIAGTITSIGVIMGQIMGTLIYGILLTNWENLPELMREFGFPSLPIPDSDEYWQSALLIGSACSMFNLLIIIGLGALGGVLWVQRHSQKQPGMAQM